MGMQNVRSATESTHSVTLRAAKSNGLRPRQALFGLGPNISLILRLKKEVHTRSFFFFPRVTEFINVKGKSKVHKVHKSLLENRKSYLNPRNLGYYNLPSLKKFRPEISGMLKKIWVVMLHLVDCLPRSFSFIVIFAIILSP